MKKTLFLIITLCLISLPTKAGIIWTLNDFTMSDGSQFSGFIEVDSGSVIDWDITNNKVYSDSPGYYNTLNSIASMYSTAIMINEKNTNWRFQLSINDTSILNSLGPNIEFVNYFMRSPTDSYSYECRNCSPYRYSTGGGYLTSANEIPEPSIFILSLMSIFLLRKLYRKQ